VLSEQEAEEDSDDSEISQMRGPADGCTSIVDGTDKCSEIQDDIHDIQDFQECIQDEEFSAGNSDCEEEFDNAEAWDVCHSVGNTSFSESCNTKAYEAPTRSSHVSAFFNGRNNLVYK